VFGVLAVASDSCWALAAGRARDWFARKPHRLDRLGATGGVMMSASAPPSPPPAARRTDGRSALARVAA